MAFDESQRGRGLFYSDKNRGSDSTIESAYIRSVQKSSMLTSSDSIIIDGKTINEVISSINSTTTSLKNSIEVLSQQEESLRSQINELNESNSQLSSKQQELEEKIKQLEQGQNLPIASTTQLGVIKVGSGLQIEDGTLNTNIETVSYDDGPGGLEATNVSDALQELTEKVEGISPRISDEDDEELVI